MKFRLIVEGTSSQEWKNNYSLLKEDIKEFANIEAYSDNLFGFYIIESSMQDIEKVKQLSYVVCIHSIILKSATTTFPSA